MRRIWIRPVDDAQTYTHQIAAECANTSASTFARLTFPTVACLVFYRVRDNACKNNALEANTWQ